MARDHSSRSLERKGRNTLRINPAKFILYVEGEKTEPSYFAHLRKAHCKVEPVTKEGKGIGSCMEFVEEAEKKFQNLSAKERNKYAEKWVVFDNDGHHDFAAAIKRARTLGFGVAFSNMCIEYWFVLHFEDHDGGPVPMASNGCSQAHIDILNKHISRYNKRNKYKVALYDNKSKEVTDDIFDLLLAIDPITKKRRIVSALERAKAIHEKRKKDGAEFSESVTTIYELLLHLGVFDIDRVTGEYALYEKS